MLADRLLFLTAVAGPGRWACATCRCGRAERRQPRLVEDFRERLLAENPQLRRAAGARSHWSHVA